MTKWFLDATSAPVPGGWAARPDFVLYMSLVENTVGPWFKLSVFGELGLNNSVTKRTMNRNFACLQFRIGETMHLSW